MITENTVSKVNNSIMAHVAKKLDPMLNGWIITPENDEYDSHGLSTNMTRMIFSG